MPSSYPCFDYHWPLLTYELLFLVDLGPLKESAKKLARIWLEKRLFSDKTMYYVARSFKKEIDHDIPGADQLPVPEGQEQETQTSSSSFQPIAPSMGFIPPQMAHMPPHSNFPGMMPPMGYPSGPVAQHMHSGPLPTHTFSLVEDLSKLGDLDALLGVGSAPSPHKAPSSSHANIDPRYPPSEHSYGYNDGNQGGERGYQGNSRYPPGVESRFPPQNDFNDSGSHSGPRRQYDRPNYGGGPSSRNGGGNQDVREGFREPEGENGGPLLSDNLFVGSLPLDMGENDLREMFSKFGHIRRVTVKGGKGFGFVAFGRRSDAEMAKVNLDGTQVLGKQLRIKWARSDKYRDGTVDPETGVITFGDAASSSTSQDSSSQQDSSQSRTYGMPRGVRPQYESSFADGPEPSTSRSGGSYPHHQNNRNQDNDSARFGKRRFEGDQPTSEKKRFADDGFHSLTSWSGND